MHSLDFEIKQNAFERREIHLKKDKDSLNRDIFKIDPSPEGLPTPSKLISAIYRTLKLIKGTVSVVLSNHLRTLKAFFDRNYELDINV